MSSALISKLRMLRRLMYMPLKMLRCECCTRSWPGVLAWVRWPGYWIPTPVTSQLILDRKRLGSIILANVPFSFPLVKRTRSELKNAKIISAKIEKINSAWSIPGSSSAESLDDARC
jgi:hypothetical protein